MLENRYGLLISVDVRHAASNADREDALALLDSAAVGKAATLGADTGYDTFEFVDSLKARGIEQHNARHDRPSGVDKRIACNMVRVISQQIRKRIDEPAELFQSRDWVADPSIVDQAFPFPPRPAQWGLRSSGDDRR